MMLEKPPHPIAAAEEAKFAGRGIDTDVGLDDFVQAIQDDLNFFAGGLRGPPGWADAIGREEVEVLTEVDVAVLEIARGDLEQAFRRLDRFLCHGEFPLLGIRSPTYHNDHAKRFQTLGVAFPQNAA
jgi:hypothetical protein